MNTSRQVIVNASAHSIPLPDGMIHTVATSPPYYSLRSYQGEQEIDWPAMSYSPMPGLPPIDIEPMRCALGLEPQPESYIGHLVLCFREVYRVMRDDATAWVVMGDSFSSGGGPEPMQTKWQVKGASDGQANGQSRRPAPGLQQGDLMLIPARLALALQGDGWIVRNDVVWSKKSCMPESIAGWRWERCKTKVAPQGGDMSGLTYRQMLDRDGGWTNETHPATRAPTEWQPCPGCDKCSATGGYVLRRGSWRHTRAHETVLMCVKGMGYYADQERVREAWTDNNQHDIDRALHGSPEYNYKETDSEKRAGWFKMPKVRPVGNPLSGRNPRSVLTPSPESYPGAHYAVFSRTLIAPLLRATAPTRVCPVCGASWAPVVERETGDTEAQFRPKRTAGMDSTTSTLSLSGNGSKEWAARGGKSTVLAHRPTCECYPRPGEAPECFDPDYRPGWALDPFAGTFTTGEVCAELGVNAVGIDLSMNYLDSHAKPRINLTPSRALDDLPLFEGMAL